MTTARYARAPSPALEACLQRGLLAPLREAWRVHGLPLDVQLREKDEVMLYCGLTRLLVARFRPPFVTLSAHKTYASQACAEPLMRRWRLDEDGLREALAGYLRDVEVNPRFTRKEGAVQAGWLAQSSPWTAFDREAVVGGGTAPHPRVTEAADRIRAIPERWRRLEEKKSGNEIDAIAVDLEGRLTLIEVKWGGADDLYYAPLQALRYAWEWAGAAPAVLPELQALIEARQRLGMSPHGLPRLRAELRVAVAWGAHPPSVEVRRRLGIVLGIVNEHLPAGVPPVELWRLDGTPRRV
jgi:hypothetical protein